MIIIFMEKKQQQQQKQLYKETPGQIFFYEICGIFNNNIFYRTPPVAAADNFLLHC